MSNVACFVIVSRAVLLRPEMVERIAHSINFYVVAVVDTEENTVNGESVGNLHLPLQFFWKKKYFIEIHV